MILPVDSIDAPCVVPTRIAVALVDVDLTVRSRSARLAYALITIYQVLTDTAELARVRLTLVYLCVTQVTREPRMAHADKGVFAVDTLAMLTRRGETVVYVRLAG